MFCWLDMLIDEGSESKCSKLRICYSLTKNQKKIVLDWVKVLKLSYGYVSNLAY